MVDGDNISLASLLWMNIMGGVFGCFYGWWISDWLETAFLAGINKFSSPLDVPC